MGKTEIELFKDLLTDDFWSSTWEKEAKVFPQVGTLLPWDEGDFALAAARALANGNLIAMNNGQSAGRAGMPWPALAYETQEKKRFQIRAREP